MTFNERLKSSTKTVQALFELFDSEAESRLPSSERYSTNVPDYRLKHPIEKYVFCDIIPMLNYPALRINIRIDGRALPSHSIEIIEVKEERPGGRWIQINLTKGSELFDAFRILDCAAQ